MDRPPAPQAGFEPLIHYLLRSCAAICLCASFLVGCADVAREPQIAGAATGSPESAVPTPTSLPLIELDGVTVQHSGTAGDWVVYGLVRNSSERVLDELVLGVALVDRDGELHARVESVPAQRLIAPGDQTAFSAAFQPVTVRVDPERVRVSVLSYREALVEPLEIIVDQVSSRTNIDGGTTFLGFLSNVQPEHAEIRNVEAYFMNDEGLPVGSAEAVLTASSVAPHSRNPVQADFIEVYGENLPVFYVDAVPIEAPDRSSTLWAVTDPVLFSTAQGVHYYLIELRNTAFAPQVVEGLFAISEWRELVGLLPVHSPLPIPPQGSWYVSLEPDLELPVSLRSDEERMEALTAELALDPLGTHGVDARPIMVDLAVDSVESIGGSLFMRGTVLNNTEEPVNSPTVFGVLRTTGGEVVGANSERLSESIPAGEQVGFTLALLTPAGTDPAALEFDLIAIALPQPESPDAGT